MADSNWSDFRVILTLRNEGSIAGAARVLGIDASTVSRRLAAAEKAFGATLIVRGGRDFTFTPEGLAVAEAAHSMDMTVNTARQSVKSMREELAGTIRVACVPTAAHVLRPLAREFAQTHEGLSIELLSSISGVDLSKGDADIAVRTIPPKDPSLVIAYRFTWGSCLYASKDYLAQHGRPADFEQLSEHDLVRYGAPLLHSQAFGWVEQFANPKRPATRVENSDSARVLIEQSIGIGPLFCAVGDACETLVRVFPEPFNQMDSWVMYHESTRGTRSVRVVLDALTAFLRARQPMLTGVP